MELNFQNVCKTYNSTKALDSLSLRIDEPGIYGLIGSNGAGKTTTIKLILNQIERTSGTLTVNGTDVRQLKPIQNVFSYIPDEPIYYEELTVREHFEFVSSMYHSKTDKQQLIKRLELAPHLEKMPDALSKGTRQKLSIGCALLRDFDILLADEPFSGLDPRQIAVFWKMLKELADRGKIILLSTHLLRMIDQECKKLIVLHNGTLKGYGTLNELKKQVGLDAEKTIDDVYFALTGEKIEDGCDNTSEDDENGTDDEIFDEE